MEATGRLAPGSAPASAWTGTAVAPWGLSPDPEKTSARHHHLNVSPRRPAHHRERAVVRLIHLQPYDLA